MVKCAVWHLLHRVAHRGIINLPSGETMLFAACFTSKSESRLSPWRYTSAAKHRRTSSLKEWRKNDEALEITCNILSMQVKIHLHKSVWVSVNRAHVHERLRSSLCGEDFWYSENVCFISSVLVKNPYWSSFDLTRKVIERSIKAQIEGLDVHLHILNKDVHILGVELRYVFSKLRKKRQFCQFKLNILYKSHILIL